MRVKSNALLGIAISCSALLLACEAPDPPIEAALTRFSAADMQQAPQIVPDRVLRIGDVESRGHQVFNSIEDIVVDAADHIYVIDDSDACAREFNSEGTFVRSVGRRGPGPGECAYPFRATLLGDSLFVYDRTAIQVFVKGHFIRSIRLSLDLQRVLNFEYASAGPLVALTGRYSGAGRPWPLTANRIDLTTGQARPPIAALVMPTLYDTGHGTSTSAPMSAIQRFVFGSGGEIYSTRADSFRIEQLSADGRVVHTIVADLPRVRVTDEDVRQAGNRNRERLRNISPRPSSFNDSKLPRSKYRPAIGGILAGDAGRLLVERMDLRGNPTGDQKEWVIVAPNQPVIGRLLLPSRFTPHVLRGCFLTGVQRNTLNVQAVEQYRLHGGTHPCS